MIDDCLAWALDADHDDAICAVEPAASARVPGRVEADIADDGCRPAMSIATEDS